MYRLPVRSIASSVIVATLAMSSSAAELSPEELNFFESKIRPVLVRECYGCHSNETGAAKGGLRLDTERLTHIGGDSGPAIVPGQLNDSLLWSAINHEDFNMPPKRKLSADIIEDFRVWIEMGAPDPRETQIVEIKSSISEEDIRDAKENFWAYQKPVAGSPPPTSDTSWCNTEIDQFVLARLESEGIQPAGDAESYKVLRRLCFDLTGLPPTPDQIARFKELWNSDPDAAVETVVDRLLDSEQFGERWGRHWLDVARYAESTGRAVNMTYPHAWRYRDYVIDSFNADKPFDQFIVEQLAGDLMPAKTDDDWTENLVATTFLAIGPKNVNEQSGAQFAADLADEQLDTTTRVFMGTSVACARCHDHKFDPIPQTDYYALAGIFRNMTTYYGNPPSEYGNFSGAQTRRKSSLLLLPVQERDPVGPTMQPQQVTQLKRELESKLSELADLGRQRRSAGGNAGPAGGPTLQQQRLRLNAIISGISDRLAVVDDDGQLRSYCMGVQATDSPQDSRVLVRGEIDQPGQLVPRDAPQVLRDQSLSIKPHSTGRLEMAKWIASDQNPLTARVMVNRIWQHLIGQGFVTTTENFGATGQPPSHPELLDWLAVRFVESGWSVKSIVRDIATSRVYRIRSAFNERYHHTDPDNKLVWRANPRRLDAEAMRDAMLSAAGNINLDRPRASEVARAGYTRVRDGNLGNAATALTFALRAPRPEMDREQVRRAMFPSRGAGIGRNGGTPRDRRATDGFQRLRAMYQSRQDNSKPLDMVHANFRSVYMPIVRDEVPRSLEVFDFAESTMVVGKRESSNTPNQALYLMNNPFVIAQSEALAKRVIESKYSNSDRIEEAFLLTFGRPATRGEREAMAGFIKRFEPSSRASEPGVQKLSALCQSLFAAAEFRYVD